MTDWKIAMLCIAPFMPGGAKPRAWLAVFLSSILAFLFPLSPAAYLAIDLFCGGLVLAKPAGIPQKSIGLLFAMMAIVDAGYLVSPQLDGGLLYYGVMSALGWLQFVILTVWGGYDAWRYCARRFGSARGAVAHRTDIR